MVKLVVLAVDNVVSCVGVENMCSQIGKGRIIIYLGGEKRRLTDSSSHGCSDRAAAFWCPGTYQEVP